MIEDEMVGWHHRLNGREFQQTLGDGEGHERLKCCGPWGGEESDVTEGLNNNIWTSTKSVMMTSTPQDQQKTFCKI